MGKAEELAAAVEGLEGGKGKRRTYPKELRQRLVDFVREQRAAGKQLKSIAARVGVSPTLLHRWEMKRAGAFRRVELQRPPSPSATTRYVLRAPHGVRVEDLGVDELVTILQRLG
jgi:transposase-like protein